MLCELTWAYYAYNTTTLTHTQKKDDEIKAKKKKRKEKQPSDKRRGNNSKFYAHAWNEIGIDTKSVRVLTLAPLQF